MALALNLAGTTFAFALSRTMAERRPEDLEPVLEQVDRRRSTVPEKDRRKEEGELRDRAHRRGSTWARKGQEEGDDPEGRRPPPSRTPQEAATVHRFVREVREPAPKLQRSSRRSEQRRTKVTH